LGSFRKLKRVLNVFSNAAVEKEARARPFLKLLIDFTATMSGLRPYSTQKIVLHNLVASVGNRWVQRDYFALSGLFRKGCSVENIGLEPYV